MPIDLALFGKKLRGYREQFELSLEELSRGTGISATFLDALERGQTPPNGDQVLILADFFRCDFKFFISNERLTPFEQTEKLFRRHGEDLSAHDRWAIQEFLFLSEVEAFLQVSLGKTTDTDFKFQKKGSYLKGQATEAAANLRRFLGYSETTVSEDIYNDLRRLGLHVFRRRLDNSAISGLFVKHPVAGKCILVNYSEDVYRQRFTAAHELAHAILDEDDEAIISFKNDKKPREVRANTFASRFLLPPNKLKKLPSPQNWKPEDTVRWANELMVSTTALAYALSEAGLVDARQMDSIRRTRIAKFQKEDPEIPSSLSQRGSERRKWIIDRGLSSHYVSLAFDSYRQSVISAARLTEVLLLDNEQELQELAALYGESFSHGN